MDKDFIGRHILIDVVTTTPKNLNNMEVIYELLELMASKLNMTLIHPPIVARIPFASSELERYTNMLKNDNVQSTVIDEMSTYLSLRATKLSGISAMAMWLESHSSIHTWPETNFFSFDAYSCKNFEPTIVYQLLSEIFDIKSIQGSDVYRYMNVAPKVSPIQILKT